MKLLWNLLRFTLIHKIVSTITSLYKYSKDYSLISDTLYSDELKLVLRKYLNTDFEKDWIGRLYGVINPVVDINGNINFNNVIIELDGDNTNSTEYVKAWVYKQMQLIGNLFKIEKLYDYIYIEFKHVGPEQFDNYLIIFDISSRIDFVENLKKTFKQTILYIILATIAYFVYAYTAI